MANLRSVDMMVVDQLFQGDPGYVLNFSNSTFAQFFAELDIDIYDDVYAEHGGSKMKRLRCFFQKADDAAATRVLKALWEYREEVRQRYGHEEKVINAQGRFLALLERVAGRGRVQAETVVKPAFERAKFSELNTALMALGTMEPQPRGYAFEAFLKKAFDTFGMEARSPFRVTGEQIDGSFLLGHETYLLEAKWQNQPTQISDLRAFDGKVGDKAVWTRGLFVSYSGFSADALHAFGRGKRIVCADGLDFSEALARELPLDVVLERKVRHAAEKGVVFARVRDLF